ncbi:MAG: Trp biosynthesis-associated membrane protein [Pseudonocardiaceae bacterium]
MPERARSRRALASTIAALVAASAMLGGAAMLSWAQLDVQVPLRGIVQVRVPGSAVAPALTPLALLALAAVAAALASPAWARWLLGALLLVAAAPAIVAGARVLDGPWLTGVVMSAGELPARAVPVGAVRALFAGPTLAVGGAVLLAAAGVVLGVRGHRMPRLGHRYQAPTAGPAHDVPAEGRFWERMNAGEDPTASGHPR